MYIWSLDSLVTILQLFKMGKIRIGFWSHFPASSLEQRNRWEQGGKPNDQPTIRDPLVGRIQSGSRFKFCFDVETHTHHRLVSLTLRRSSQLFLSLSPSFASIKNHLCKVLGNKVLPLICLIVIIAYWILGIALPTPESNILNDNVSNCTWPVWGSFYASCVFDNLIDDDNKRVVFVLIFWSLSAIFYWTSQLWHYPDFWKILHRCKVNNFCDRLDISWEVVFLGVVTWEGTETVSR